MNYPFNGLGKTLNRYVIYYCAIVSKVMKSNVFYKLMSINHQNKKVKYLMYPQIIIKIVCVIVTNTLNNQTFTYNTYLEIDKPQDQMKLKRKCL